MTALTVTLPCTGCNHVNRAVVKSLAVVAVQCGGSSNGKRCNWQYWVRPRGRDGEVRIYEVELWAEAVIVAPVVVVAPEPKATSAAAKRAAELDRKHALLAEARRRR